MIKNNSFYTVWFLVIGVMVVSTISMHAMQLDTKRLVTFISLENLSQTDIKNFISDLKDHAQTCKAPSDSSKDSCNVLNNITPHREFFNQCWNVTNDDATSNADKTTLAQTLLGIKFNENIPNAANFKMDFIKRYLPNNDLLTLEIKENNPEGWSLNLSKYQQCIKSLNAITDIDRLISEKKIKVEDTNLAELARYFRTYLQYINLYLEDSAKKPLEEQTVSSKTKQTEKYIHELLLETKNTNPLIMQWYNSIATIMKWPSYQEIVDPIIKPTSIPPAPAPQSLAPVNAPQIPVAIPQFAEKPASTVAAFQFLQPTWPSSTPHKGLPSYNPQTYQPTTQATKQQQPTPVAFGQPQSFMPQQQVPTQTPSTSSAWPHFQTPPAQQFNQPQGVFPPTQQASSTSQQQKTTYDPEKYNIVRNRFMADAPDIDPKVKNPMRPPQDEQQKKESQQEKKVRRQQYLSLPQLNALLNPKEIDPQLFAQSKKLLKQNIDKLNLNLTNPNAKISQEEMEEMANRIVGQVNLIGTAIDAFTILELRNAMLDKYSDPDLDSRLTKPVVSQKKYQGILPLDDSDNLKAIENLDRSKQSILATIDTIDRFFQLGCPIKYQNNFIGSVIELAKYPEDNIIDNYKSIISNNNYFKIICKVLINGPSFQNQENFRIACAKLNPQLVVTNPWLVQLHPQPMTPFAQAKAINQSQTPRVGPTGNKPKTHPQPAAQTLGQPPAVVQPPKTTATPQKTVVPTPPANPGAASNQSASSSGSGGIGSFFYSIGSSIVSTGVSLFSWIGSGMSSIYQFLFGPGK